MSDEHMNSYRLTSMEEPGDERMAQIMREVSEDAQAHLLFRLSDGELVKRYVDELSTGLRPSFQ